MRREILAFLLISTLAFAALDQTHIHTVDREGASLVTKSMDITVFSSGLDEEAFARMQEICLNDTELTCSVEGKTITMTEQLLPGQHYSFESEYGVPSIEYTMTLKKIPTDTFSLALDKLLRKAGAVEGTEESSVAPIDLQDAETNREGATFLRRFKANLTYTIIMPTGISYAKAGNVTGEVSGSSVTFDMVSLMEESEYVVVKSSELNMGFLIIFAAAVVLAALALSFFTAKRPARRKK